VQVGRHQGLGNLDTRVQRVQGELLKETGDG